MIGIGMSSSIPQFNLKDVNNALIKLLWNPSCDFEEIYCAPDFATGGILLNEEEVKESLKNGTGKACKLRSVVEFDSDDRCFIVKEIPYSVYTNTICKELESILNSEENPGIDRFNDLTGSSPMIKIYISKKANPNRVIKYLYKNTSLQSYYSINMTMLEDGRYPKVFGWKETLIEYINHQLTVYSKGFEYDLEKYKARLHIVEGILTALAHIEEVIKIIKESNSTYDASIKLQNNFSLSEIQAKEILNIRLARLAHLEIEKFETEKRNLLQEINRLQDILDNEFLLKKEVEKGLIDVRDKFGDNRRTQIMNLSFDENGEDPIEEKELTIHLTNLGNIYSSESSTLVKQKKGGKGKKIKLLKNESIICSMNCRNSEVFLMLSNLGKMYVVNFNELMENGKTNIHELLDMPDGEFITYIISYDNLEKYKNIIFVTKNGIIKKGNVEDYKTKRKGGVRAIKIKENDSLVNILFSNKENICVATHDGKIALIDSSTINETGRASIGVKGVTLKNKDYVVDSKLIGEKDKYIITITENGIVKKTEVNELNIVARGAVGTKIQKIDSGDKMASFEIIEDNNCDLNIITNNSIIKVSSNTIPVTGRGGKGSKGVKVDENKVTSIRRELI